MLRRVSVWLAIFGLMGAVFLVARLRIPEPPARPVAEPARGPYPEQIGARGIVESVDENVRIAPAVAGLITKVFVKVGDEVKAGAPLVEQDTRDARAQVTVQQAQVDALKAQITEAQVALADRKDQTSRIERLGATRVVSVDEKQRAVFALKSAESRLETTQTQLNSAVAGLNRARVQLDLLTIRAPRSGAVLQVNIREGEYAAINPPEPLILLGKINELQLRADVDEDNASRVPRDCEAVAFVKGRRDYPIPLRFVRIEPYIIPKRSLTGESSERVDTRVLQIIFRFQQPEIPVYTGQQMDVFINASGTREAADATRVSSPVSR
ncbi:efflux RND transporter periplasmic adaptor subunit [Verrucomicrobiota bacterium sgz303538]